MSESLKKKTIIGTIWSAIQKFGTLILAFITNIILARMLTPDDFGCIAILSIFIVIADTLVDSGLGSAIIQKKNANQRDFSTVFYFNIAFAIILYGILFASSPLIAKFYNIPLLSIVLRIEGLILIVNSFCVVQTAILRKQMSFKQLTAAGLISTTIGVCISIVMAYHGFGVWSLVAQMLSTAIIKCLVLWILSNWKPSIVFSKDSFRQLFGFGSFIFLSNLMNNIGNNIQGLIIGKAFNAGILGYYTQARKLEEIASTSISNIVDQVTYPVLAKKQDDQTAMVVVIQKLLKMIAFITFPLMIILAISGNIIVPLCYGDQWAQSIPYFRILCLAGIAISLQGVNYYAIAAIGKSKSVFKWTIIKRVIALCLILIGLYWGMYGVLAGVVLGAYTIYICNAYLVQHYLKYSLYDQFKDIFPIAIISAVAGMCTLALGSVLNLPVLTDLVFKILVFGILYIMCALVLKLDVIKEIRSIISDIRNRKL